MKTHAFRLNPGDDLRGGIEKFVNDNDIRAGVVLACVGSLTRTALRFANRQKSEEFENKFEIVSLEATLSVNGCHFHLSVSDQNGNLKGGHLVPGSIIFTTAEVVIGEIEGLEFARETDLKTGFRELVIKRHLS